MNDATLFLPVAGRSSRYAGMRPKWLLTHPNGTFMLTEAIRGLDPAAFQRIVVVALEAHEKDCHFTDVLIDEIDKTYGIPADRITVQLLKYDTANQAETVAKGIIGADIQGKVLIKDSDNYFRFTADYNRNTVAVVDLASAGAIESANKSYAIFDDIGVMTRIVEKRVVSNYFCSGGYCFANAADFVQYYELLKDDKKLFISHIIQRMLDDHHQFVAEVAEDFEDWGTLTDWRRYKNKFATIFINLDGIIVLDSSKHSTPKWGTTEALRRNVIAINKLHDSGKVKIIITSSRDQDFRPQTEEQLRKNGVRYHSMIMGLPYACRQILVNDFSMHTAYDAASAINTRTNDDRLDEMLAFLV